MIKLIIGCLIAVSKCVIIALRKKLKDKKEDGTHPLYADSTYKSEEMENIQTPKNLKSKKHVKRHRNHLLTKMQLKSNRTKSIQE